MGAAELAKGIQYLDPIKTSWKPPKKISAMADSIHQVLIENLRVVY
jgi:ATP-dependent RNA helicase DDX41